MNDLPPSTAADDVAFSLDTLARFYARVGDSTRRALAAVGGRPEQIDVVNLAAEMVPEYKDEVLALGHLMTGHPLEEREARKIVHDHASACIRKELETQ